MNRKQICRQSLRPEAWKHQRIQVPVSSQGFSLHGESSVPVLMKLRRWLAGPGFCSFDWEHVALSTWDSWGSWHFSIMIAFGGTLSGVGITSSFDSGVLWRLCIFKDLDSFSVLLLLLRWGLGDVCMGGRRSHCVQDQRASGIFLRAAGAAGAHHHTQLASALGENEAAFCRMLHCENLRTVFLC